MKSLASSVLLKARVAGVFYLATSLAGLYYVFAGNGFIVSGDAAATAKNILTSESLYRLDITANIVAAAAYVVVTLLLYELLKPVSRSISLLAAFFSIIGITSAPLVFVCDSAPLVLLHASQGASASHAAMLQTLAFASLRLSGLGATAGLVFFGLYCALIGYLLFNSGFFPRALGVLMSIAGICYLVNSFATLLAPALAHRLWFVPFGALIGEVALTLWLLVVGINVPKWQERQQTFSIRPD
ncbi:MAG: DUF4386 domain-containing protein [Candidatus Eremiobacteraeota bacterium]|nr:DUF4386 domain-containing protein [Candidatus Eremiobacteraeota bacterium]